MATKTKTAKAKAKALARQLTDAEIDTLLKKQETSQEVGVTVLVGLLKTAAGLANNLYLNDYGEGAFGCKISDDSIGREINAVRYALPVFAEMLEAYGVRSIPLPGPTAANLEALAADARRFVEK
jgi:hypothetical protein